MAIETSASGITVYSGPHVRLYTLVAVKTRMKLEKMLGGPQPTKSKWAKHYGLPARTKLEVVLAKINDEIDAIMTEHPITPQEKV